MDTGRTTKLTLAVDSSVIRKAKGYAANQRTSVSSLVQSYLKSLTESEYDSAGAADRTLPPIKRKLCGAVRLPEGTDPDQLKWGYLSQKYLRD